MRGGKRENSGRKKPAIQTGNITIRLPVEEKERLSDKYKRKLNCIIREFLKSI